MKEKEPTKESIDAARSFRSVLEYGTHDDLREEIECAPERLHLEGAYPLARAARMRDLEAVKILVEAGAPLDACGTERYELMAARNEREEFDCPLVECLNQRYDEGRPDNEDQVFSYLLQAGANPNLALKDVAIRHDVPKLHALIDAGADIKTYGGEALWASLDWNYNDYGCRPEERGQALEVVSTLLKHGADMNGADVDLLLLAGENNHPDVAEVLMNHGAEPTLEIAEWSTGEAKDLIRARYEQDLLRRHLPQVASDHTQTPSIQPSRKQRL